MGWEDVEKSCLSIYSQMCCCNYKPEAIIALLRGGVVPGRIFSDYFNILLDFFALDVNLYDGIGVRRDKPDIKPFDGDVQGKKILIIDDIWDSGKTMNAVLDYLNEEDVTTATLYWKETSEGKPDYYAETVREDVWLVFPWEKYEFWKLMSEKK
jgi:hypoxanthine phosphoribosyltransferase